MVKLSEAISYSKHYNDGTKKFSTIVNDGSTSPFFSKPSDASSLKNWDGYYYTGAEEITAMPKVMNFGKDQGRRTITVTIGKYKMRGGEQVDSNVIPAANVKLSLGIAKIDVPDPTEGLLLIPHIPIGDYYTNSSGQCEIDVNWGGLQNAKYPIGTILKFRLNIVANLMSIYVPISVNVDMLDIETGIDPK